MNGNKKYLIISDSSEINGGCAKVAIQTAVGLANAGKDVIFFAGRGKNDSSLIRSNIKIINLQMESLTSGNKIKMFFNGMYNFKSKKELSLLLSTLDINDLVIHVHSWIKVLSNSIFDALKKYNCNFFITIHDYFLGCPNGGFFNYNKCAICKLNKIGFKCLFINCDSRNYFYKIWRWIRFKIQKKCLKKCNYYLIDISSFTRKYIHLNEIDRFLVRNPIDMNNTNYIIDSEKKSYAFVGRVTREKGIELFCNAMAVLGYDAYVYGTGYLEEELIEKYKKNTNIHFMGWVDSTKLKCEYKKIKALIFPSMWYEGAPLAIPEIQSYGIPCIVSDACAGKDYIVDGINGYVFESNNLNSLIEKINLIENKKYQKEDKYKIQKIALEKNNTENQYIEKLLNVYFNQNN